MITLFLFLTAPITANFIAKVHIHRQESRETMPPAGEDDHWATHDTPEDEERKRRRPARQRRSNSRFPAPLQARRNRQDMIWIPPDFP